VYSDIDPQRGPLAHLTTSFASTIGRSTRFDTISHAADVIRIRSAVTRPTTGQQYLPKGGPHTHNDRLLMQTYPVGRGNRFFFGTSPLTVRPVADEHFGLPAFSTLQCRAMKGLTRKAGWRRHLLDKILKGLAV